MEFEQKKAANEDKINQEKRRIEKYISNINELNEILHKVCNDFGEEINNKKKELNYILDEMNSFHTDSKHTAVSVHKEESQ